MTTTTKPPSLWPLLEDAIEATHLAARLRDEGTPSEAADQAALEAWEAYEAAERGAA